MNIKLSSGKVIPVEMHRVRIVQKTTLAPVTRRLQAIEEAGYNTFLLRTKDVFLDMLTDSGTNAMSDNQLAAMMVSDDAYAGSESFYKLAGAVKEILGFDYTIPVHQGRAAEHLLAKVFVKPGDVVLMKNERLAAIANPFSLACDVTAPLVSAGTLTELESVSAHGKFLLLYGDLTRAPLSPKSWFLKDERDEHMIQILESMQPAAIIAPPTATDYYGQLTEDWELDLPAITVPSAVARGLMRHADSSLHLKISARRIPAQARNIVARKIGRESGRIVLCAHFDSKINTPGASDNAAGVAVLLELAERLSKKESRFGLEFIAFNGEEYLPIGDDEYMQRAESYFPDIRCALNLDGILSTESAPISSA